LGHVSRKWADSDKTDCFLKEIWGRRSVTPFVSTPRFLNSL
jgi:hypothetical protein